MSFPKVLILNQPFVPNTGGGITLSNLFSGWEKEYLAVACSGYLINSDIDFTICDNYYQLGHKERKWIFPLNLFGRKYPSGRIQPTNISNDKVIVNDSKSKTRVSLISNYVYPALDYLGFTHFVTRTSPSKSFKVWLDEFSPEVIYAQSSSLEEVNFCIKVHQYLKIPFIFHMMDDWPSLIGQEGFMKNFWKTKADKDFKRLINVVDVPMAISDYMAKEYKKRYGKDFETFHNPIEIGFWKSFQKNTYDLSENPTVLYAGRIGLGIDESLRTMAKAIEEINQKLGMGIRLVLQAPELPVWIKKISCVEHRAFVDYRELPKVFSEADLLILPYDFTDKAISFIKYSMPTKASEYMACGVPILVFSPRDTALVEYANEYKWAAVVTENNVAVLVDKISCIFQDKQYREEIAKNAKRISEDRHEVRVVSERFKKIICDQQKN